MNGKARARLILERVVLHLWCCAAIAFLIQKWVEAAPARYYPDESVLTSCTEPQTGIDCTLPRTQLLRENRIPPDLTVFPGLNIDETSLAVVRVRQPITDGFKPYRAWKGRAFSGWLVLPLLGFETSPDMLVESVDVLRSAASAVEGLPKPNPVIVDLGGLKNCPEEESLMALLTQLEAAGLKPAGHEPLDDEPGKGIVLLEQAGTQEIVLFSLRIDEKSNCPTLPSLRASQAALAIQVHKEYTSGPHHPLIVTLLHWVQPPRAHNQTALHKELVAAGADLIVGFAGPVPAPPLQIDNSLFFQNVGLAWDRRGLLAPNARSVNPAGQVIQCFTKPLTDRFCRAIPTALSLIEAVPVPDVSCPTCAFLPGNTNWFPDDWHAGYPFRSAGR